MISEQGYSKPYSTLWKYSYLSKKIARDDFFKRREKDRETHEKYTSNTGTEWMSNTAVRLVLTVFSLLIIIFKFLELFLQAYIFDTKGDEIFDVCKFPFKNVLFSQNIPDKNSQKSLISKTCVRHLDHEHCTYTISKGITQGVTNSRYWSEVFIQSIGHLLTIPIFSFRSHYLLPSLKNKKNLTIQDIPSYLESTFFTGRGSLFICINVLVGYLFCLVFFNLRNALTMSLIIALQYFYASLFVFSTFFIQIRFSLFFGLFTILKTFLSPLFVGLFYYLTLLEGSMVIASDLAQSIILLFLLYLYSVSYGEIHQKEEHTHTSFCCGNLEFSLWNMEGISTLIFHFVNCAIHSGEGLILLFLDVGDSPNAEIKHFLFFLKISAIVYHTFMEIWILWDVSSRLNQMSLTNLSYYGISIVSIMFMSSLFLYSRKSPGPGEHLGTRSYFFDLGSSRSYSKRGDYMTSRRGMSTFFLFQVLLSFLGCENKNLAYCLETWLFVSIAVKFLLYGLRQIVIRSTKYKTFYFVVDISLLYLFIFKTYEFFKAKNDSTSIHRVIFGEVAFNFLGSLFYLMVLYYELWKYVYYREEAKYGGERDFSWDETESSEYENQSNKDKKEELNKVFAEIELRGTLEELQKIGHGLAVRRKIDKSQKKKNTYPILRLKFKGKKKG